MKPILSKRNSKYLKMFLFSHLIAYLSLNLIPASAAISNKQNLILLNLVFIFLVTIFFVITVKLFPTKIKNDNLKVMTRRQFKFNAIFVSFSAITGFIFMVYDRVFIRGIDYSLGLRHARYQWLDSTGGSLYSVLGNLLIPFGYVALFLVLFHNRNLLRSEKAFLVIASITSVLGHAALNGGRSNILIAVVFVGIILVIKSNFSKKLQIRKPKYIKIIIVSSILIGYMFYITLSSAAMGSVSMQKLTILGIESLYGKVSDSFYNINSVSTIIFLLIYSIAYMYHGQWTAEIAFSLMDRSGNYTFYTFIVILRSLGIPIDNIGQGFFAKTGAFISLPGAFYYDFGYFGVVVLSSILGILFSVSVLLLNNSKAITPGKIGFIIYILFIIILSPMLPGYGFMYMNFIFMSFVGLDIINRIIFKQKVNFITRD